mmetsp:Transcript_14480/g.24537  ORF Transcript_14480/g.24537 Transcript_14480/m.24537 type:complete len:664 (+) Transcript_14480:135-2126(+)|eukprot:CAMPEP_0198200732 /NCGR_PEP_ID=MMETSP1445-20131203/3686_1 /TAXON_ID=36898 /ORGANISM="Pyramimonas sp., Strain CCMP2087" /LENGTH=663 /DNA_ID=CAMNT_0043870873 /DNA_START=112 /DNA_END=2103 /DNA_ORIENTATION=+
MFIRNTTSKAIESVRRLSILVGSAPGSKVKPDDSQEGVTRPPTADHEGTKAEEAYKVLLRAYRHSDSTLGAGQRGPRTSQTVFNGTTKIPSSSTADDTGNNDIDFDIDDYETEEELAQKEYSPWDDYVLMHNSRFRVRWDISQAFVLVYLAILVPMRIGFNLEIDGVAYIFECFVELYFWVDMFLNFITTYEDENLIVVTSMAKISTRYFKGWFTMDAISVLPIDLAIRISANLYPCSFYDNGCGDKSGTSQAGQYIKIIKLLRLIRLVKLLRLMRLSRLHTKYQDDMFHLLRVMAYVKLIVLIVYLGHIFGCMFYFFSDNEWHTNYEKQRLQDETMSTWLLDFFVPEGSLPGADETMAPLTERYVAAAYWAFTTMTTVGYGDIKANSVAERSFAILGMIVGGLMLSTVASNIMVLFAEANMDQNVMKKRMLEVELWVKTLRLNKSARIRVLTFFRRQTEKPYSEKELLMKLPFEMRCLVVQHNYGRLIEMVPFFKDADHVFRCELCLGFETLTLMPRMYIYLQGENGRDMYVISEGVATVVDWHNNTEVGQLSPGAYFGEGGVVGDFRRRETFKSATMLHLYVLPFEHMKNLLDMYPEVRAKLLQVYEQRIALYNDKHPITYKAKYLFLSHNASGEVSTIRYGAPSKVLQEFDTNRTVNYRQ